MAPGDSEVMPTNDPLWAQMEAMLGVASDTVASMGDLTSAATEEAQKPQMSPEEEYEQFLASFG